MASVSLATAPFQRPSYSFVNLGINPLILSNLAPMSLPDSPFFRVLTAPYRSPQIVSRASRITSDPPTRSEESISPEGLVSSGTALPEDADRDEPASSSLGTGHFGEIIYKPFGKWSWIEGLCIRHRNDRVIIHSGKTFSTGIGHGKAGGREIKYLYKTWSLDNNNCQGFFSEIALFKRQLRSLQGVVVPSVIGVYTGTNEINVIMELPHQSFWINPSPDMPAILKTRCVQALQKLHDQGVCHSEIDLSQILIGGDGSIFFINFHASRALEPNSKMYLDGATHGDLRLEMRKLKYLLDYRDARHQEEQKYDIHVTRARNKLERRKSTEGPVRHAIFEEDSEEDMLNPPLNVRQRRVGWNLPSMEDLTRYDVPGQAPEDFERQIENFFLAIRKMEAEESLNDNLYNLEDPPPPSSLLAPLDTVKPLGSKLPSGNVLDIDNKPVVHSPTHRYMLRKRKLNNGTDHANRSPKRLRMDEVPSNAGLVRAEALNAFHVERLDSEVDKEFRNPAIKVRDFAFETRVDPGALKGVRFVLPPGHIDKSSEVFRARHSVHRRALKKQLNRNNVIHTMRLPSSSQDPWLHTAPGFIFHFTGGVSGPSVEIHSPLVTGKRPREDDWEDSDSSSMTGPSKKARITNSAYQRTQTQNVRIPSILDTLFRRHVVDGDSKANASFRSIRDGTPGRLILKRPAGRQMPLSGDSTQTQNRSFILRSNTAEFVGGTPASASCAMNCSSGFAAATKSDSRMLNFPVPPSLRSLSRWVGGVFRLGLC